MEYRTPIKGLVCNVGPMVNTWSDAAREASAESRHQKMINHHTEQETEHRKTAGQLHKLGKTQGAKEHREAANLHAKAAFAHKMARMSPSDERDTEAQAATGVADEKTKSMRNAKGAWYK